MTRVVGVLAVLGTLAVAARWWAELIATAMILWLLIPIGMFVFAVVFSLMIAATDHGTPRGHHRDADGTLVKDD